VGVRPSGARLKANAENLLHPRRGPVKIDIRKTTTEHLIGATLGTCRMVKELGRGSMGIVFVGYQMTLKRPVAVKILPKSMNLDKAAGQRFLQEAETAAILAHPNIIPIYEVGETEDLFFMVMQLVRGMALHQLIEKVRKHPLPSRRLLPLNEVFRVLLQLLDGLGYAHEEEVVHRDIKPANILIEAKSHRALISDFGIARELRGEDMDRGKALGTPLYMAPEQAAAKVVDSRADIYSVGVILFEMAAGNLPIYAESIEKLRQRKLTEPLGLFSMSPSKVHPRVDARLEEIILHAMALDRDERYSSCGDLAADLKDYQARFLTDRNTISRGE
jgi:eukaryotic-like serine/threonine-protein kinase